MTRPPTRLAGLPRGVVVALLALAIAFAGWSALPSSAPPPRVAAAKPGAADSTGDLALYGGIVAAMRDGASYYPAVVAAHRAENYPLRPSVAVRLPTLATIQAHLPPPILVLALWLLTAAVVALWAWRVYRACDSLARGAIAALLVLGGMAAFTLPRVGLFHELWAAPLVALALALWRPAPLPWASLALAAAALAIRETAVVLPIAMICAAAIERRWREALAWAGLIALFAGALALHAAALAPLVRADDLASPGWSGLLGWGFVVEATSLTSVLRLLPGWLAGVLLELSLAGWAGWRDPRGLRAAGTLVGFALLIGLFGRPDTFYWALMFAPLSLMGLVFVPALAADAARVLAGTGGPR